MELSKLESPELEQSQSICYRFFIKVNQYENCKKIVYSSGGQPFGPMEQMTDVGLLCGPHSVQRPSLADAPSTRHKLSPGPMHQLAFTPHVALGPMTWVLHARYIPDMGVRSDKLEVECYWSTLRIMFSLLL